MKKKIYAYLLLMLPALLMTSCLKDQEDIFPESASERNANYLANVKKVLTSSANGWVLDYFPDRKQSYGGYSYTLFFDENTVTVSTEISQDVTQTETTTYILDNEDGPCLAFDTYNDYLHYFATPHGSSGAGGYEAYDGDFIFAIMNVSEDGNTITLKGNRSGNIMYMHRISENIVDYQLKLAEFVENLVFDKALGIIDGKEYMLNIAATDKNRKVVIEPLEVDDQTEDGEGSEAAEAEIDETIEAPFCYDKDGITLYAPVNIGGKEVRVFKYDENQGTFTAQEDNSVVFTALLTVSIVINNVGEQIILGNGAASLDYTFNLADKFTYTPDVDWITVSAEGKNLKINVTANTTGETRAGNIIVEVDGQTATITIVQMPINGMFVNSETYVALSNISAAAQPYFLACKALSDSEGENIGVMLFADFGADYGYGLYFESSTYWGLLGLNAQLIGNNEVKFTYDSSRNLSSANWYYNNGYKTLINYLVSTSFVITADNEDDPTYFVLTDKNDSSKYFKLTTDEVANPFAN